MLPGNDLYANGIECGIECMRRILYATGRKRKEKKNINRSGGCDAPVVRFI